MKMCNDLLHSNSGVGDECHRVIRICRRHREGPLDVDAPVVHPLEQPEPFLVSRPRTQGRNNARLHKLRLVGSARDRVRQHEGGVQEGSQIVRPESVLPGRDCGTIPVGSAVPHLAGGPGPVRLDDPVTVLRIGAKNERKVLPKDYRPDRSDCESRAVVLLHKYAAYDQRGSIRDTHEHLKRPG
jgi:hypothetical protein